MPKNVQTTAQLHSSHMLASNAQNSPNQASFRKGRGANIHWIIEKARKFQKNICFCFIDYTKALYGSPQTVENSERGGNTRPPDLPPEKSVCRSRSNG